MDPAFVAGRLEIMERTCIDLHHRIGEEPAAGLTILDPQAVP
jgi:hypothetical protein